MSWAARRRFIILLIIGAVVVAFMATIGVATFYEAPSCSDSKQNQGESGVDCGSPCSRVCTAEAQPPTVLFTKAINNGEGRVDVIAMVENKNADAAAKNVQYSVTLYGADQVLIQKVIGILDLPPGASVPIFVPGISSGRQTVGGAFLDIDSSSPQWFSMPTDMRIVPIVSNIKQGGTILAPRIEATLTNPSVTTLINVRVIVLVHNTKGDVIAASSTVVPTISTQGRVAVTFTWNYEFSSAPASIEVVPVIPLP